MSKPELKAECIRLRVEDNLSFRDIEARTGASKGSLSIWLKPHPLPPDVVTKPRSRTAGMPKKDRGVESEAQRVALAAGLDANQKGRVAELAVQLKLALRGFEVFGASTEGSRIDWVVRVPTTGKLWSVQVKLAFKPSEGLPLVSLRCSQSQVKYLPHEFDFLVGYDLFTDTAYVWKWSEVSGNRTTVSVPPEAAERWDKLVAPL